MTKTELEMLVLQQDDQIKLLQKMVYHLASHENPLPLFAPQWQPPCTCGQYTTQACPIHPLQNYGITNCGMNTMVDASNNLRDKQGAA